MYLPVRTAVLTILAALLAASCGEQAAEAPVPAFPTAPLIDPNTAAEAELGTVPGLDAARVAAIIDGRPFATPTEFHEAIGAGLSDEQQRAVYGAIFVQVELNTSAEEDLKLIPSTMSPRKLAHEFEEYRPYESMDQFTREMAKYVSDQEAAYLTRYVTLD